MFKGSIVAIVTPMSQDGSVDYCALESLIQFHIESKTDAIVSVGTTGESTTLSPQEHMSVVRFTKEAVNGRVPVIAGTGANSTSEALEFTDSAAKIGVDACLLVVPYYNKPTQKGLYEHFAHIAKSVDIPQILYNVPSRTIVDLLPETVVELSKYDNIIGVKEATGDISRVDKILSNSKPSFSVLTGEDACLYDFMAAGGHGIISVTANVVPKQMHDICELLLNKKFEEAKSLQNKLMPLHQAMFLESSPIPVKYALYKMKMIDKTIRLPLLFLDENYHNEVDQVLREMELIK